MITPWVFCGFLSKINSPPWYLTYYWFNDTARHRVRVSTTFRFEQECSCWFLLKIVTTPWVFCGVLSNFNSPPWYLTYYWFNDTAGHRVRVSTTFRFERDGSCWFLLKIVTTHWVFCWFFDEIYREPIRNKYSSHLRGISRTIGRRKKCLKMIGRLSISR